MHGYFIDMKLYTRLHTVSEPFAYEEYCKRRIREKVSEGGSVSPANDSFFNISPEPLLSTVIATADG